MSIAAGVGGYGAGYGAVGTTYGTSLHSSIEPKDVNSSIAAIWTRI